MKKWTVVMLVLALFASSGTSAFAHGWNSGQDNNAKSQQQSCNQTVAMLNQVLQKTKNEKSRALLSSLIASFKAQCTASSGNASSQNTQKVTEDKNALAIQYLVNDNANNVTLPVILPSRGKNGSTVTWTSSNPNVLSSNGLTVHRQPSSDVAVDLTAVLKYNNATATRTFRVIVKGAYPQISDADRVARDKAALAIGFGGSDNAGSVTQPFKSLPGTGANGSAVKWNSTSPAVISNDGKVVNRPASGTGDVNVVFIANIRSGSATDIKLFTVTVKQQLPDAQKVEADKAALQIDFGGSDSSGRVTRPFDSLPSRGVNGSTITWTSSSPNLVSSDGRTVHRPAAGTQDQIVFMTAIISSGGYSTPKIFTVTVKGEYTNQEKAAADKADLAIAYKGSDTSSGVTQPVGLPTKGYYGSTIAWYSNNTAVLSNNGASLHRPAHGKGDVQVTLTAIVSYNGSADVRTFTVTVKQL